MQLNFYPTNGMNPYGGYGRNEIGIARGLQAAGVDVRLCTPDFIPFADAPVLITGNPAWGERFPHGQRKFLYTMSETTRISPKWVDLINRLYEAVLVPVEGLVEVFRNSGVAVPVAAVGHTLEFAPPFRERTWQPGEPFTFLTYSMGDFRKGAELAMLAFKRLFGSDARFRLVVKAPDYESWLDGCLDEQVEIVRGEISESRWHALLDTAHAFLFPSRGEGFGMPPREAALAGLPTVATAWLGMADVEHWGFGLPVERMSVCYFTQYEANAEGAQWAEPSRDALDEHMRWIVAHYAQAVAKARRGRNYLLHEHDRRRVGAAIMEAITTCRAQVDAVPYQYGAVQLFVRDGEYAAFDRGIVAEVQHSYFWDTLRARPVRTVIDVGAHIGAFTRYARHVWPDATIIAVEAERENAALLRRNTDGCAGIHPHYARVGYAEGDFVLAKARGNSGGHIVIPRGTLPDARYRVVELSPEVFTLEALMARYGFEGIDMLKLDCEGSEFDILAHVSDAALARIGAIVGERHRPEAEFMALLGGRLEAAGFVISHAPSPEPALGAFLAIRR